MGEGLQQRPPAGKGRQQRLPVGRLRGPVDRTQLDGAAPYLVGGITNRYYQVPVEWRVWLNMDQRRLHSGDVLNISSKRD